MPLSQDIIDSVANSNLKNLGDGPAFYTGLAMGNAVAHQQTLQQIQAASVGQIVKKLTEVDVTEAISVLKATTGNEVAGAINALQAALASSQQQVKTAQTTPPTSA